LYPAKILARRINGARPVCARRLDLMGSSQGQGCSRLCRQARLIWLHPDPLRVFYLESREFSSPEACAQGRTLSPYPRLRFGLRGAGLHVENPPHVIAQQQPGQLQRLHLRVNARTNEIVSQHLRQDAPVHVEFG
jgi:hypothetical protein